MNGGLLELMKVFTRVVETGSFTAVALESGSTQPTVSRQISALEAHLSVRLFHRTTRAMNLTEEGRRYYEHALAALDAVDAAQASVGSGHEQVAGVVRVTAPHAFARLKILPRLKAFLSQWPQVDLDLHLSDRAVDLVEDGIDLAIRIGEIKDQNLVARRIGETRRVTVAAPDYMKGRKRPRHPRELVEHDCIVYSGAANADEWRFVDPASEEPLRVKVSGRVRVNGTEAMRGALFDGLGVAITPTWALTDEIDTKRLLQLLAGFEPAPLPIHAVYPTRRLVPPRVRAFLDFLIDSFAADPTLAGRGVASARALAR